MKLSVMLASVVWFAMAPGCQDLFGPDPDWRDSVLEGVWTGTISGKPMRMEIVRMQNQLEGVFVWQDGAQTHRARISGISAPDDESIGIEVVLTGTRTTLLILRGAYASGTLEGTFTRRYDIGLPASGSWKAVRDPEGSTIYGAWNWIRSIGGIAGMLLTPPPRVRIEYSTDDLFLYYRNDTLIASTGFMIDWGGGLGRGIVDAPVIRYEDSTRFVAQVFRLEKDSLHLGDLCIDCFNHTYARKR